MKVNNRWLQKIWPIVGDEHSEIQKTVDYIATSIITGLMICCILLTYSLLGIVTRFNDGIPLYQKRQLVLLVLVVVISLVYSWRRLSKADISLAIRVPMYTIYVVFSIGILFSQDGFYDTTFYLTAILMVLISTYLSEHEVVSMGRLVILLVVVLYVLEASGFKETPHPPPTLYHLFMLITGIYLTRLFLQNVVQLYEDKSNALRRSRDELRRYKTHLEDVVNRRTAELIMAKNRAEEANLAKSQFLANMSHELRTPLNAIIGYSEMMEEEMRDDNLEGEYVRDAKRVYTAAYTLLGLINNILDLSKIEANHVDLEMRRVQVKPILIDTLTMVEPLFQKSGNEFRVTKVDEQLSVYADEKKLMQILINILSNANKFTHQGKIELKIKSMGDFVRFVVDDTGIGIDEELIPLLFKPFLQANNGLSRQYQGTGLGLTISKKFCEMMSGRIEVSSELGVGTRFEIYIPKKPLSQSIQHHPVAFVDELFLTDDFSAPELR